MLLSELISKAQKLLHENGDLEILDKELYALSDIYVDISEGDYPEDYDLPKGEKFIIISSYS